MEGRRCAEHEMITIVTGANNGIGYETTRALAGLYDHTVVMACRNREKAEAAKADILKSFPNAKLDVMQLDLADLDSIQHFCTEFSAKYPRLDLLINNAGILNVPNGKTKQGLDLIMGTNFFGPFALTATLYPSLLKSNHARIVTLGSDTHRFGKINFGNFHGEIPYKTPTEMLNQYASSKLANMMFAFRMNRLFKEAGIPIISIAVHPGSCAMNSTQAADESGFNKLFRIGLFISNNLLAMSNQEGAQSVISAAISPGLTGGEFLSRQSWFFKEMRGNIVLARASEEAYNDALATRLWNDAEKLTNTSFTILPREDNTLTCASAAARML